MAECQAMMQLAALLETQTGICDDMIVLSQREQQALVRCQPACLPELLAAQDDCADQLAKTLEALDEAVRRVASDLGLGSGEGEQPLEIGDLLPHLPADVGTRLDALRDALEQRAYTLAVLNAQNAHLVRAGLLQIDRTAAVLASVQGEPRAYEAGGGARIPLEGGAQFLNCRA